MILLEKCFSRRYFSIAVQNSSDPHPTRGQSTPRARQVGIASGRMPGGRLVPPQAHRADHTRACLTSSMQAPRAREEGWRTAGATRLLSASIVPTRAGGVQFPKVGSTCPLHPREFGRGRANRNRNRDGYATFLTCP